MSKEHLHALLKDVARLRHSYHMFIIFVNEGDIHESSILFKSEKLKVKVYRCFGKDPRYDTNHG